MLISTNNIHTQKDWRFVMCEQIVWTYCCLNFVLHWVSHVIFRKNAQRDYRNTQIQLWEASGTVSISTGSRRSVCEDGSGFKVKACVWWGWRGWNGKLCTGQAKASFQLYHKTRARAVSSPAIACPPALWAPIDCTPVIDRKSTRLNSSHL